MAQVHEAHFADLQWLAAARDVANADIVAHGTAATDAKKALPGLLKAVDELLDAPTTLTELQAAVDAHSASLQAAVTHDASLDTAKLDLTQIQASVKTIRDQILLEEF